MLLCLCLKFARHASIHMKTCIGILRQATTQALTRHTNNTTKKIQYSSLTLEHIEIEVIPQTRPESGQEGRQQEKAKSASQSKTAICWQCINDALNNKTNLELENTKQKTIKKSAPIIPTIAGHRAGVGGRGWEGWGGVGWYGAMWCGCVCVFLTNLDKP